MKKINPEVAKQIQETKNLANQWHSEWAKNLENITKIEINNLITNPNRNKLRIYLFEKYLDLADLLNHPETLSTCLKLFDDTLKSLIENDITKKLLLSWKEWTEMFGVREKILKLFSNVLDKEIVALLEKHTKYKKERDEFKELEEDEI